MVGTDISLTVECARKQYNFFVCEKWNDVEVVSAFWHYAKVPENQI